MPFNGDDCSMQMSWPLSRHALRHDSDGGAAWPDCHVATKPSCVTLPSDVNSMNIFPDTAVTVLGMLWPLKRPRSSSLELVPSRTVT